MKYMGSKRTMLLNGLGNLIAAEIVNANRFVDLFSGSAAVTWYAATRFDIEVQAIDLQHYSSVLASAVIGRISGVDSNSIWSSWATKASKLANAAKAPDHGTLTQKNVRAARKWCAEKGESWILTKAYGGHYFSPSQAIWLDAFRKTIPNGTGVRDLALASLIDAASKCAAAPGHTAQPFQPTKTAKKFLQEAWDRDPCLRIKNALASVSALAAKKIGKTYVQDANVAASNLEKGDLVFVDPPYSGVHYSRFYHVLETITCYQRGEVSGIGRYPSPSERPRSDYSISTKSVAALDRLLSTLSTRKTRVILTFPDHRCSNGLSGDKVSELASKYFSVTRKKVKSRFSTLGGNGNGGPDDEGRAARQNRHELILLLSTR